MPSPAQPGSACRLKNAHPRGNRHRGGSGAVRGWLIHHGGHRVAQRNSHQMASQNTNRPLCTSVSSVVRYYGVGESSSREPANCVSSKAETRSPRAAMRTWRIALPAFPALGRSHSRSSIPLGLRSTLAGTAASPVGVIGRPSEFWKGTVPFSLRENGDSPQVILLQVLSLPARPYGRRSARLPGGRRRTNPVPKRRSVDRTGRRRRR